MTQGQGQSVPSTVQSNIMGRVQVSGSRPNAREPTYDWRPLPLLFTSVLSWSFHRLQNMMASLNPAAEGATDGVGSGSILSPASVTKGMKVRSLVFRSRRSPTQSMRPNFVHIPTPLGVPSLGQLTAKTGQHVYPVGQVSGAAAARQASARSHKGVTPPPPPTTSNTTIPLGQGQRRRAQ